ncbi:MAG: helix-turn-helix domain-containing protein [Turicibacter sp.]|nr:helix-turn-helix domain-containing protein [Turicibacter sp.]
MENQTLGEKIKIARINKGLKQSELSDLLGVRSTAISSWENNLSKPDVNKIEIMCSIFEVSPNYFFNIKSKNSFTNNEIDLIEKYRKLDTRGQKVINSLVDVELEILDA